MQRVLITHDYNDNRRSKINGFGRLGVSGRISSITTTHLGWDARHWPIPFVNVHRATVSAALAPRSFPEAEHQPVVVILGNLADVAQAVRRKHQVGIEDYSWTAVAQAGRYGVLRRYHFHLVRLPNNRFDCPRVASYHGGRFLTEVCQAFDTRQASEVLAFWLV